LLRRSDPFHRRQRRTRRPERMASGASVRPTELVRQRLEGLETCRASPSGFLIKLPAAIGTQGFATFGGSDAFSTGRADSFPGVFFMSRSYPLQASRRDLFLLPPKTMLFRRP
jgi:hypothetical protein